MRKQKQIIILAAAAILGLSYFFSPDTAIAANELSITPANTNVTVGGTQTFTVTRGNPPYTWRIDRDSGGSIQGSGNGSTATYTAGTQSGNFTITVTDNSSPQKTGNAAVMVQSGGPSREQPSCAPGTGRVRIDGQCKCPAGLKGETNSDASKCIIDNPAPGLLVELRSIDELLQKLIRIALYLAGAIAVVFLIIGGFRYVTSLGNEEAMEKAKKTITSAVIGIIVIVMAFSLVAIINTLLTRNETGQGGTPPAGNPPGGNGGNPAPPRTGP